MSFSYQVQHEWERSMPTITARITRELHTQLQATHPDLPLARIVRLAVTDYVQRLTLPENFNGPAGGARGEAETTARESARTPQSTGTQHTWYFYMNGTFCTRCGAAIGSGLPCR